jgi:hypothetical protein
MTMNIKDSVMPGRMTSGMVEKHHCQVGTWYLHAEGTTNFYSENGSREKTTKSRTTENSKYFPFFTSKKFRML